MDDDTPRAMTRVEDDPRTAEEIRRRAVEAHPIELEPRIDTLDRPLIVECAYPGWQPRLWPEAETYGDRLPPNYTGAGEVRYPAVPTTFDQQADELVEAVEAGCAAAHVHPRDPTDGVGNNDPELVSAIYDRVQERTDVVPLQHSWTLTPDGGVDFIGPAEDLFAVAEAPTDYLQGGLVLWPPMDSYPRGYEERVAEALEFYHDHGVKPIHKLRGSYHARKLYRTVIEGGLRYEEPLVIVHDMGHPYGWPMDSATWSPVELVSTIEQTRERFSGIETVIGVYTGNRNWLPTTVRAILAGVDMVRVGIEDYYWMYPHRDEVIESNLECVRKITEFCELVGRPTADAAEAREILGMAAR